MTNPFVVDNRVELSVVLPIDREAAWEMIGTPTGYSRWFASGVDGVFAVGETVTKSWWWGEIGSTEHRVLAVEPGDAIEFDWEAVGGSSVRYSLGGDGQTAVSLVANYPRSDDGRAAQLLDVAPWTFAILNLKSVASSGVDLRHRGDRPIETMSFID